MNTCHAVKAAKIKGLQRGAKGAGGRAISRTIREKAKNTA